MRQITILKSEPDLILTLPLSLIPLGIIILIRPLFLIRVGFLHNDRLGHFGGNTEMFVLEKKEASQKPGYKKSLDLFYLPRNVSCNKTMERMWSRILIMVPRVFARPLCLIIRSFKSLSVHRCGATANEDRDIHNLMDKYPPSLSFSRQEEEIGKENLVMMGIPNGAAFVCLNVRDSAYLSQAGNGDYNYHNYRDSDIQNYVLASEELADRGYFVIRMGVHVHEAMKSTHPRVIDYATKGMRSDFMDIYLGAKCEFCISVGSGFDAVPLIFQRPTVYVNMVPMGYLCTFIKQSLAITKHYYSLEKNIELTLNEIFDTGIGFSPYSADYQTKKIQLIENTPEEIRDVVVEMAGRMNRSWQSHEEDEALQKRFWEIFPTLAVNSSGARIHGEIRMRFGSQFLRNNQKWLQ